MIIDMYALNEHNDNRNRYMYDTDTKSVVLKTVKPNVCRNYEPCEGVCLIENTWCDNCYYCRLPRIKISCANTYDVYDIAVQTASTKLLMFNPRAFDMVCLAVDMILRGEYH